MKRALSRVYASGPLSYIYNDMHSVVLSDMATTAFDTLYGVALWGGVLIALLRFRLFDADAVIARSAAWLVMAPLLALIFGLLSAVLKSGFDLYFAGSGNISTAVAGVLTALSIKPINSFAERRIERLVRGDLIALAKDLPAAARDLRELDDEALLLDHVCAQVARAMKAGAVAVAVQDGAAWRVAATRGIDAPAAATWLADHPRDGSTKLEIDRDDARFAVRIPLVARPQGEAVAVDWLMVGRRPDGSVQDKDARDTLAEIAPAIGRALHVMTARQRRDRALDDRIASRLERSA